MPKTQKANSYDVKRDRCVAPAMVLFLDAATGAKVGAPGEGVLGFGFVARQMDQLAEDGTVTPGKLRIAVVDAFRAKASEKARMERWIVGAKGKCTLGAPVEGSICLGGAIGRLDPHIAAVVFDTAAGYTRQVMAALSKVGKAA
jgi:hypothetical protein